MPKPNLSEIQHEFFKALKSQNNILASAIDPIGSLSSIQCLEIYSKGYKARLTEALGETFEATWWCLGDEDFFDLTSQYIQSTDSFSYDLSDYGVSFPDFLRATSQSQEIPFLPDLARFEWAFKNIFHKPSIPPDLFQISRLREDGTSILALSDSAQLFESRYSIYEIWKMRTQPAHSLHHINSSNSECLLVCKKKSQVFVYGLKKDEYFLATDLVEGKTLVEALDHLNEHSPGLSPERVQELFSRVAGLGVFRVISGVEGAE